MDIGRLKEIIWEGVLQDKSKFTLATKTLESNAICSLSKDYFPENILQLDLENIPNPVVEPPDGNSIIINGTGLDYPFKSMAVEACFYLNGNEAAIRLTAACSADWKMQESFPIFKDTLAEEITFSQTPQAKLLLSSHSSQCTSDLPAGMFFEGAIDLDSTTAGLSRFLGLQNILVKGPIVMKENATKFCGINLEGGELTGVDLKIAKDCKISFSIGSSLFADKLNKEYAAVPYIELDAEIPFSAQRKHHTIPLSVKITNFHSDIRFAANISEAIEAGLDELKALTNDVGLDGLVPPNFDLENLIKIADIYLDYNLKENNVNYIGIGLQSAKSWGLDLGGQKCLTAQNLKLDFRLDDPFGIKKPYMFVGGEVSIPGSGDAIADAGIIVISADYPNWNVQGHLKDGSVLAIGALAGVIIGDNAEFPKLDIDLLSFELYSKGYELNVSLKDCWIFELDTDIIFAIEELGCFFVYDKTNGLKVILRGAFIVAGIDIYIKASYESMREQGWEFSVETGPGQKIPIGNLINDLVYYFGDVDLPKPLSEMTIDNLKVKFNTRATNFAFSCDGIMPIGDKKELDIKLNMLFNKKDKNFSLSMTGCFKIEDYEFDIDFEHSKGLDYLVAIFNPAQACTLKLRDIISKIWVDADEIIPESLEIQLEDVFFVLANEKDTQGNSSTKVLFGVDVGSKIDLSEVDVIGSLFQKGTDIGIDDLQALIVTKPVSSTLLDSLNNTLSKLSENKFKILSNELSNPGLYITSIFNIAGFRPQIELPIVKKSPSGKDKTALVPVISAANKAENVHWCSINKTIGPIQLRRIGIGLDGNKTKFEIDVSLVTTSLEIDILGLWIGVDISARKLSSFGIHGLDVSYCQEPLFINGGLLYVENPIEGYKWEINGQLIVKYNKYGFFASASYAQHIDKAKMASLFAFLMVSAPIGGPPYLYISGLAGGFGFNRGLIIPEINQLSEFPLVQGALGTGNIKSTMKADEALQKMDAYVPPKESAYWLAVGMAVGSCHIINAFVMVAGVFGTDFDLAIIGIATADIPTNDSPRSIAHLELAVIGNFNPKHGSIEIMGALTSNSYIFSPKCKITGGFAYCIWLEKGDFVVSVGGYSNGFKRPGHYPALNRLGINWQISSNLIIKGGAYYAFTPSCAMAGGELSIDFNLKSIHAWLNANADLLMEWLPFHYDVSIGIRIGVSVAINVWFVHKTFKIELGADLHIWGPKFAGEVKVKLWIVSFTISFGENKNNKPQKLNWDDFKKAFLSGNDNRSHDLKGSGDLSSNINNVNIKEGLIGGVRNANKEYWIVSPNKFVIETSSTVPSTHIFLIGRDQNKKAVDLSGLNTSVGIRPMGKGQIYSEHVVSILQKQTDENWEGIDLSHIIYHACSKNMPDAIWSTEELKGPSANILESVPIGLEISALDASYYELGEIETDTLMFESFENGFSWGVLVEPTNPKYPEKPIDKIKSTIMSEDTANLRDEILKSLNRNGFNLTDPIDLKGLRDSVENIFYAEPKLFELGAKTI